MNREIISVIGADPGPSTGISFLDYEGMKLVGNTVIQVDGDSAQLVLEAMLTKYYRTTDVVKRFAEVEAFKTGASAGTKSAPGEYTRQGVFMLTEQLQLWGYTVKIRKAGDIKTWASDKRLKAADILRPPENRHGNDASRHALFAAVHDAHRMDPLR